MGGCGFQVCPLPRRFCLQQLQLSDEKFFLLMPLGETMWWEGGGHIHTHVSLDVTQVPESLCPGWQQ